MRRDIKFAYTEKTHLTQLEFDVQPNTRCRVHLARKVPKTNYHPHRFKLELLVQQHRR